MTILRTWFWLIWCFMRVDFGVERTHVSADDHRPSKGLEVARGERVGDVDLRRQRGRRDGYGHGGGAHARTRSCVAVYLARVQCCCVRLSCSLGIPAVNAGSRASAEHLP